MEEMGEKVTTGEAEDGTMTENTNMTPTENEIAAETEMGALVPNL